MTNFIFITLLAISNLIELAYDAGVYYHNHLHNHVYDYTVKAISFIITLGILAYEGMTYLYSKRHEVAEKVWKAWIYESPSTYQLSL